MKKSILILTLLFSNILFAQDGKKEPLIINLEGVVGLGGIYDADNKGGAIGVGAGVWLPFKEGFIDLGLDVISSASRNSGEFQILFDYPFSLISDSLLEVKGYVGAGITIGRLFNKENYFWAGVEDYNKGGLIGNIGLEFKPLKANYAFYLDAKTGIVSVPGWAKNVTTPFKLSIGCRFLLDNSK